MPFFFFGTLRDPLMLEAVLGRPPKNLHFEDGWLDGFAVERAEGYTFPTLTSDRDASAKGHVVHGLTQDDALRIAYFEDSEYLVSPHKIRTAHEQVTANLYFPSPKLRSSGEAWSFDRFQALDRGLLLEVTRYVMREHYGVTPQHEMEQIWGAIRDRIARGLTEANTA